LIVTAIAFPAIKNFFPKRIEEKSEFTVQQTKTAPLSYQIADVPYYSQKGFCYGVSTMMILKYSGLGEQQVQKFKKILEEKGRGGPPDIFIGLKELNLINSVRLVYSKNYNQKFADFYKRNFNLGENQIINFANFEEGLFLKQKISAGIPVIVLIQRGNHYVVVTGYDQEFIYLNDPDLDFGKRKMAISDFLAEWENYKQDIKGDQIGFPGEMGMIWLEK
jgi:uncharacterized protein YvpB